MSHNDIATLRVQHTPASDVAREVGGWLLAEMPSSHREVGVYPSAGEGLALEFGNASWDLTVEICSDGFMLLFGEEVGGVREIDPFPYDARSGALVEAISRIYAANDR